MTTLVAKPTGHPLCVQRFDSKLDPRPLACVDVGATVLGGHALRDGGVAALVDAGKPGTLLVVRWNGEADAAPERRLVTLEGRFKASRARADGDLVVVTDGEVARIAPDGTIRARRPIVVRDAKEVAAAPDGAWLLSGKRLAWYGLDGSERTLTGPHPAPRWRPGLDEPPGRSGPPSIYAMESNDVVVVEDLVEKHPVHQHRHDDVTSTLLVTRVDREGRVLAETNIGEVRVVLEWFWTENSSSNPTSIPQKLGLVRKRRVGNVALWTLSEGQDGGIVMALSFDDDREVTLRGFDDRLRERWSRRCEMGRPQAAAPAWSRGLLFSSRFRSVDAFDDRGRSRGGTGLAFPEAMVDWAPDDGSIGQNPSGEWFVVVW